MLLQAGITKIHYLRNYHNDDYAMSLIERKHVALQQVKFDQSDLDKLNLNQILLNRD
jgi:dCMP deaminase